MDYSYFIDKVCTVITQQASLPLKDSIQHSQYFTGVVKYIDEVGIWLEHLQLKTMAFYGFPIIGIVEEQYIPESSPAAKQIREEVTKKKPSNFMPVEMLTEMAKKLAKRHP